MLRRKVAKVVFLLVTAIPLLTVQVAARAEVIGGERYLSVTERRATLDRIDAVLAREEVRQQLERYGVDAALAGERVAALNDRELSELADNLEELPAGGSVIGVVGVVFLVLLILELVGVIDIFKKI